MLFVTACDDNYFIYALAQIMEIDKHFDQNPVVYDLGLDTKYKEYLSDLEVPLLPCPSAPPLGKDYPNGYQPRALWKPSMLLDACLRFDEDIVYLDADAKPVCRFKFPAVELGLAKVENWNGSEYVGPWHSGVMFLGNTDNRAEFILEWAKDIWRDKLPSDKKSLNRIMRYYSDIELQPLSAREYNSRKMYPETKILHRERLNGTC